MDNIEVFKEKHWKRILEDARGHIKKNKWNEAVATSSKSNDIVIVKAESNKRQRKIVVDDSDWYSTFHPSSSILSRFNE